MGYGISEHGEAPVFAPEYGIYWTYLFGWGDIGISKTYTLCFANRAVRVCGMALRR